MERKRIILVTAFVLSIIIFALLLYRFFFSTLIPSPETSVNQPVGTGSLPDVVNGNVSTLENTNGTAGLPDFLLESLDIDAPTDIARGGLTNVTDYETNPVKGLATSPTGARFYDEVAGRFYELAQNQLQLLSDQQFYNVEEVTWSGTRDKAILEYPDGSNVIYDFAAQRQITLPRELEDFSFDATGAAIAAKWIGDSPDENWLMVGTASGSDFQLIEPLGDRANDVQVGYSPDNTVVATVRKASGAASQTILPIGTHGENFQEFEIDGLNYQSMWSPADTTLLYSTATADNNYNPKLYITSGSTASLGSSHLDLQLSTWPSKCTFNTSGTSIYCAEPIRLPRGAGLYPDTASGIPDAFYRVDLRSGQKIPLAYPVGSRSSYSAESVYVSADESTLYFVDSTTQELHSIRLK